MGLVRRVAYIAACALLACCTYAQHFRRGPFLAPNVDIAADLNLDIDYVMSSPNQCGAIRLRRNGMIHSHQQLFEARRETGLSLETMNKTERYNYPDDINCTFSVSTGNGWRVQLLFPMGMQLTCGSRVDKCDCLEVFDGPTVESPLIRKVCGHHSKVDPIQTTYTDATLRFVTDRNCKTALGFQVKWYAFRLNDKIPCTNEEFLCDTNRCISNYFLCDGTFHCLDKTDEGSTGCNAEQKLCRMVSTIARYKKLALSIFILLLLVFVFGALLCSYYVLRMRRNQISRTRILALNGGRKPDDGREEVAGHRPVVTPIVSRPRERILGQSGSVRSAHFDV